MDCVKDCLDRRKLNAQKPLYFFAESVIWWNGKKSQTLLRTLTQLFSGLVQIQDFHISKKFLPPYHQNM